MGSYTQVLPIRYNSRKHLDRYLREMLGSSDFHIESFFYEQWTVRVPYMLSETQIETLKTKMRRHYYA
ncbi:hypothetical protein ANO14919_007240 [Xylariales sp. No.14919]|nr:hypothetical protein ANO14919_007240 [Xylariales sp. No.14919]